MGFRLPFKCLSKWTRGNRLWILSLRSVQTTVRETEVVDDLAARRAGQEGNSFAKRWRRKVLGKEARSHAGTVVIARIRRGWGTKPRKPAQPTARTMRP